MLGLKKRKGEESVGKKLLLLSEHKDGKIGVCGCDKNTSV